MSKWMSTTACFPKINEPVVLTLSNGFMYFGCYAGICWKIYYPEQEIPISGVIGWMPLSDT